MMQVTIGKWKMPVDSPVRLHAIRIRDWYVSESKPEWVARVSLLGMADIEDDIVSGLANCFDAGFAMFVTDMANAPSQGDVAMVPPEDPKFVEAAEGAWSDMIKASDMGDLPKLELREHKDAFSQFGEMIHHAFIAGYKSGGMACVELANNTLYVVGSSPHSS